MHYSLGGKKNPEAWNYLPVPPAFPAQFPRHTPAGRPSPSSSKSASRSEDMRVQQSCLLAQLIPLGLRADFLTLLYSVSACDYYGTVTMCILFWSKLLDVMVNLGYLIGEEKKEQQQIILFLEKNLFAGEESW